MPDYTSIVDTNNNSLYQIGIRPSTVVNLRSPAETRPQNGIPNDSSRPRAEVSPQTQYTQHIDTRQYIGFARTHAPMHTRALGSNAKLASEGKTAKSDDDTARAFKLQNEARRLAKSGRRVRKCLRVLTHVADRVELRRRGAKASFNGLQTCGSVWDCPVCMRKITERRAIELDTAGGRWIDQGGYVYLVTHTLAHNPSMTLKQTLAQLQTAYRLFNSGRAWQELKELGAVRHTVRSIEVTIGDNGWHPHIHVLIFADPIGNESLRKFEALSAARWVQCVRRAGGSALSGVGYKLTAGDTKISEYIAKYGHQPKEAGWSIGRELSKSVTKRAAKDGLTPQQLLMQSRDGNKHAGALWREYSDTMHGRLQLVWSRGLRAAVGMEEEESDDAVAAAIGESDVFAEITRSGWSQLMTIGEDVRGALLQLAAAGDVSALLHFCEDCGLRSDEVIVNPDSPG